jgi:hypothetical protein
MLVVCCIYVVSPALVLLDVCGVLMFNFIV